MNMLHRTTTDVCSENADDGATGTIVFEYSK